MITQKLFECSPGDKFVIAEENSLTQDEVFVFKKCDGMYAIVEFASSGECINILCTTVVTVNQNEG